MLRTLRLVLVTLFVAVGLTVVPVPTVAWAEGLETVTRPLGLQRALSVEALGILRRPPAADHHEHADEGPASPAIRVRQGGDNRTDPFTAIGVTLDVQPDGPVAFRVRENGGWGPWRELSFSEDHVPDGEEALRARPGITSDPFVVDRATGYQIQVPENVDDADVHLVTLTDRRIEISLEEDEAGAGTPQIHRRSEWGARRHKGTPGEAPRLSMAVVHHSAGASDQPTATILRSIQAYHMDGRGWSDIGYNFAVDRSGEIWEARAGGIDRAIVGAHAGGFNTRSTGVVILGDYDVASPTSASLNAVQQIISWKFAVHHVVPNGRHVYRSVDDTRFGPAGDGIWLNRVIGHRDVGTTSCPGSSVYSRLGGIRTGVHATTRSDQPVVPAKVLVGRWNGDARDDLLMYRPGSGKDRRFYGSETRTSSGILGLGGTTVEPALTDDWATVNGLYEPLVGDFDGDGYTDILWYGEQGRSDYVWWGRADGGYTDSAFTVNGTYEPFLGDFDGDGRTDIYWHRGSEGVAYVWYGLRNRTFSSRALPATGGWPEPLIGDYDGNGRTDIMFYGPGTMADEIRYGAARGSMIRKRGITINGHYRPQIGDFTGDGRDDVFWYKPGSGADYLWPARSSSRSFGSREMSVSGLFDPFVGDFDGNGFDDVLWSRSRGQDYLWRFRSSLRYSSVAAGIDSRFSNQGTTLTGSYLTVFDANGDGTDEVFAQEKTTGGRLWFWDSGGTLRSKSAG